MKNRLKYLLSIFGYMFFVAFVADYVSNTVATIIVIVPLSIYLLILLSGGFHYIKDFIKKLKS